MMKQALIKYPGERVRGINVRDIDAVKMIIKAWFDRNNVRIGTERYVVISRPHSNSSIIAVALDVCSIYGRLEPHVCFAAPAPHLCKETCSPIVITDMPLTFSSQIAGIKNSMLSVIFEWICPLDVGRHDNARAYGGGMSHDR